MTRLKFLLIEAPLFLLKAFPSKFLKRFQVSSNFRIYILTYARWKRLSGSNYASVAGNVAYTSFGYRSISWLRSSRCRSQTSKRMFWFNLARNAALMNNSGDKWKNPEMPWYNWNLSDWKWERWNANYLIRCRFPNISIIRE